MAKEKIKEENELTEEEFLAQYDQSQFQAPAVTVDMLIFSVGSEEEKNYRKLPKKALKILMIKRSSHPFMGQWALPGGFVDIDESLNQAARNKLKKETNLEIYMEQLYTWGDPKRDPRTRIISCSYMALIDSSKAEVKAGTGASEISWFNVESKLAKEEKKITKNGYVEQKWYSIKMFNNEEKLSAVVKITKTIEGKISTIETEVVQNNGIAFDHAKIIDYGIERLKNKIEYTDIAFNLMPDKFALTELQQVYEVILGKELLKANFRRKIAHMVIETDEIKKDAGHRPSKLYEFNPNWVKESF